MDSPAQRVGVAAVLSSRSWEVLSDGTPAILNNNFRDFSQPFQAHFWRVPRLGHGFSFQIVLNSLFFCDSII
jgi:hypothetical protein